MLLPIKGNPLFFLRKNGDVINMRKCLLFAMLLLFIPSTILFIALFSGSVLASDVVADSWNAMAPMNQARGHLGVVAVDGKIYAIGGSLVFGANSESNYMDANECYDPKSNTWATLTSMPTPRQGFAIAACNGKIYCIGGYGYNEGGGSLASLSVVNEVYDIVADSWSTKASLPVSKGGLHAQVVDGKIFVLVEVDSTLFMYDPVTDLWTKKTNIPYSGSHLVSALADGKIIVTGKFYNSDSVMSYDQKVLIYTPGTDTWSEGKTRSAILWYDIVAGASTGLYAPQKVYVFLDGGVATGTFVYDPAGDVWSDAKAMSTGRSYSGVGVVDDVFYVIGGFAVTGNAPLAVNEQYVPIGYRGTISSDSVSPTFSDSDVADYPADNLVLVGALIGAVIAIVVAGALLLFFKNKGNKYG